MNTLEQIVVKVTADTSDVTRAFKKLQDEAKKSERNIQTSQNSFSGTLSLDNIGTHSDENSRILNSFLDTISKPNENLASFEESFLEGMDTLSDTLVHTFDTLKNELRERRGAQGIDETQIQERIKSLNIFGQQQIEPFLDEFIQEVDRAALAMTHVVKGAFVKLAVTGEFAAKRISQALSGIVLDLLFQQLVQKPLTSFFQGVLGVVTGGKAAGGTVAAGVPTLINERGQELFIPHTPGRIMNAPDTRRMLAGGNQVVVNQNLKFDTAIKNDMMATIFQASPVIVEQTRLAVLNSLQGRR